MYKLVAGIAFGLLLFDGSAMAACSSYPNTLTNGQPADANQVMQNFNCAALTASPTFSGNILLNAASTGISLDVQSSSGPAYMRVKTNSGGTNAYLFLDRYLGSSAYGAGVNFYTSGSPDYGLGVNIGGGTSDGFAIYDYATSAEAFSITKSTGYVGIDTNSPSYPLHVNGTAYATGAAGALSDIRHKKDVATLPDGALDKVMHLRPVSFSWKHPTDDGMKGRQMGFIAQEVEKVLPSVVLTENNAEKTKGLKYNEIIAVLTKAIQEQQAEIKTLRVANDNDEAAVHRLSARLEIVEHLIRIRTAQR